MLVRPTYAGVDLMHRTLSEVELTGSMDQTALNIVARRMMDSKTINIKVLDKKLGIKQLLIWVLLRLTRCILEVVNLVQIINVRCRCDNI